MKGSNLHNMKRTDAAIHTDTNTLQGITVRRTLILVLDIKKRLHGEILKMDHLATRIGLALTTRNMGFGTPLSSVTDKLSSISSNLTLLSALK